MTEPADEAQPDCQDSNLKRVNSFKNLAIPHAVSGISKSLPQSPQRTPSRKQSITNINPFSLCFGALDEVQKKPQEASDIVSRLLEHVMLCSADESLMDIAKETGKQLYVNISQEEKLEKVNLMVCTLIYYFS